MSDCPLFPPFTKDALNSAFDQYFYNFLALAGEFWLESGGGGSKCPKKQFITNSLVALAARLNTMKDEDI